MPIISALRALFTLIVAGILGLFAAGTTAPPSDIAQTPVEEPFEDRVLQQLPEYLDQRAEEEDDEPRMDAGDEIGAKTEEMPERVIESPRLSSAIIETQTRGAVVHVLCTTKNKRSIRVTTGSGVMVDPRGVVLTNAHVAELWLLPEESPLGETSCSVRSAVPVDREYRAELLFFPAAWVAEHASDIDNPNPKGTGEHDYALLRLTEPVSSRLVFPPVFPFVSYHTDDTGIGIGNELLIAAYPATNPDASTQELAKLDIVSSMAVVNQVFTFERTTLDLISLGSSPLSFKGSSGGAVMDEDNYLVALITTSTDGETPEERELRAITLSHIERSLHEHIGAGLSALLSGSIEERARQFQTQVAPALTQALLREL